MTQEQDLRGSVDGYSGRHVQNVIEREVGPAIKEFDQAIGQLPTRRPSGKQDEMARSPYARKEEAARKVAPILEHLRHYVGIIDAEIRRCEERYRQIDERRNGLHDDNVRGKFDEASAAVEQECREAHEQRALAEKTIKDLERVLTYSAKFQYPGMSTQGVPR